MGFSGISPWSLLLILAILIMLFGTKRLRTFGKDFAEMIKSFQTSMDDTKTTKQKRKIKKTTKK